MLGILTTGDCVYSDVSGCCCDWEYERLQTQSTGSSQVVLSSLHLAEQTQRRAVMCISVYTFVPCVHCLLFLYSLGGNTLQTHIKLCPDDYHHPG